MKNLTSAPGAPGKTRSIVRIGNVSFNTDLEMIASRLSLIEAISQAVAGRETEGLKIEVHLNPADDSTSKDQQDRPGDGIKIFENGFLP